MPKENQYKHRNPYKPWKWMSCGNGGYRMYYKGVEVTADQLERFLNQNHMDIDALVDHAHKLSKAPTTVKG